jgi:hypothetical protein
MARTALYEHGHEKCPGAMYERPLKYIIRVAGQGEFSGNGAKVLTGIAKKLFRASFFWGT